MTGSPMAQSSLKQMCPSAAVVLQSQCHKGRIKSGHGCSPQWSGFKAVLCPILPLINLAPFLLTLGLLLTA